MSKRYHAQSCVIKQILKLELQDVNSCTELPTSSAEVVEGAGDLDKFRFDAHADIFRVHMCCTCSRVWSLECYIYILFGWRGATCTHLGFCCDEPGQYCELSLFSLSLAPQFYTLLIQAGVQGDGASSEDSYR
jgi:hypothetical protein